MEKINNIFLMVHAQSLCVRARARGHGVTVEEPRDIL